MFRKTLEASETNSPRAGSYQIPQGLLKSAPPPIPSVVPNTPGEPARVVTARLAISICRMVWLPASATQRVPEPVPPSSPVIPRSESETALRFRLHPGFQKRRPRCYRRGLSGVPAHPAHSALVRDVQVNRVVAPDSLRRCEPRAEACGAIEGSRHLGQPGQSRDRLCGKHDLADRSALNISDVEIAGAIAPDVPRNDEAGRGANGIDTPGGHRVSRRSLSPARWRIRSA